MNRNVCFRKDRYPIDPVGAPPCFYCKHLTEDGTLDGEGWECKAFPDGIPRIVTNRQADHRKPLPHDNGYRYETEIHITPDGRRWQMSWEGNYEECRVCVDDCQTDR